MLHQSPPYVHDTNGPAMLQDVDDTMSCMTLEGRAAVTTTDCNGVMGELEKADG